MDILIKVFSALVIASASSWITVQLSMNKFRTEKWWEKKVVAYERVIEAFHNAKKFESEHMDAEYNGRGVDEARDKELRNLSKLATDEILRASDVGRFILSERALGILAKYEAESGAIPRQNTWYEHIELSWSITTRYMKEFIEEARCDLKQ